MPPFPISSGVSTLLQQWGAIQAGVAQRLDTQSLYSLIYNAQIEAGAAPGGFSLTDMSQLRSLAVAQRNADAALSATPGSSPIDASMIGVAPWSNPLAVRELAPSWEVRFQQDVLVDGELQTRWRTTTMDGQLPGSVADLHAQLDAEGNDLAESYGETHVSIGAVSITAV